MHEVTLPAYTMLPDPGVNPDVVPAYTRYSLRSRSVTAFHVRLIVSCRAWAAKPVGCVGAALVCATTDVYALAFPAVSTAHTEHPTSAWGAPANAVTFFSNDNSNLMSFTMKNAVAPDPVDSILTK